MATQKLILPINKMRVPQDIKIQIISNNSDLDIMVLT